MQQRVAALRDDERRREVTASERAKLQAPALSLPQLPTTTIGSFPQTTELRKARRALDKDEITAEEYDATIAKSIADTIRFQEQIGIDVLVHGEPERNESWERWMDRSEKKQGTWWEDWMVWLNERSGPMVPAYPVENKKFPGLCDAPGTYVIEK